MDGGATKKDQSIWGEFHFQREGLADGCHCHVLSFHMFLSHLCRFLCETRESLVPRRDDKVEDETGH